MNARLFSAKTTALVSFATTTPFPVPLKLVGRGASPVMTMNHASLGGQADAQRQWLRFDSSTAEAWDALLLRGVDGLLAAVVFTVPLLTGGCQALGQGVLILLAVAVGVCWCARQALTGQTSWIWSSAEYLLLAAMLLVAFQSIPLPSAVIGVLSPHVYENLPLWSPEAASSARLGIWPHLSLTPVETRGGLLLLGAYAILFLVAVQRIHETDDVERLLRYVAMAGAGMAVLGLVQHLTGKDNYFWCYEHPLGTAAKTIRGSFPNSDHFAHFLVLTLGPLAWWIHSSLASSPARRSGWHWRTGNARRAGTNIGLLTAALALSVLAILMSCSTGGIAAMFLATIVCLVIFYRGELLDGKTFLVLVATGLLVVVGLGIYRCQLTAAPSDHSRPGSHLWRAELAAATDYRWLGTGVGSHAQVHAIYLPDAQTSPLLLYTPDENGYLQVVMETGLAGLLLGLAAIALVGSWFLTAWHPGIFQRELLCCAGVLPCLLASLLAAVADPVWSVPGCMVVAVLMAACACRLSQLVRFNDRPPVMALPRVAWLLAIPALLGTAGLVGPGLLRAIVAEPIWHRALAHWQNLAERDPADQSAGLETVIEDLSQVVAWQPNHALAHARLAEAHLRRFQQVQGPSGMDARHVRDAAEASRFASPAALNAWLNQAFGVNRQHLDWALQHARKAVRLCPVQGRPYLHLAALTFLEGSGVPNKSLCLEQALAVRPLDGDILFEIGQEADLAGESERARAFWQQSFQCGGRHQERLIRLLANQWSADVFLKNFPVGLPAFTRLEARYRQLRRADDLKVVLMAHAQAAGRSAAKLTGPPAAKVWLEAAKAYEELGDVDACVTGLQQALRSDASNYEVHYMLGTCLFQAKRYAEAQEHLTWCRQRKRHDETLRAMVDAIATQRLHLTRPPVYAESN